MNWIFEFLEIPLHYWLQAHVVTYRSRRTFFSSKIYLRAVITTTIRIECQKKTMSLQWAIALDMLPYLEIIGWKDSQNKMPLFKAQVTEPLKWQDTSRAEPSFDEIHVYIFWLSPFQCSYSRLVWRHHGCFSLPCSVNRLNIVIDLKNFIIHR